MLSTVANLGITANILAEFFYNSNTKDVKNWFNSDCCTFPKTFKKLPQTYGSKVFVEYLFYLDKKLANIEKSNFVKFIESEFDKEYFRYGIHDLALALFSIKNYSSDVLIHTKLNIKNLNRANIFYLTLIIFEAGYFNANHLLIIAEKRPELKIYNLLSKIIKEESVNSLIQTLKIYLSEQLDSDEVDENYAFYAIVSLLFKFENYDADSVSLKKFLYQIVVTSSYVDSANLTLGYIILMSLSERKSRFMPKPLRESNPYYKLVNTILGADK
jgi:hypothetical protein